MSNTGTEGSSDIEAPKSVDTTNGTQSCSHTVYSKAVTQYTSLRQTCALLPFLEKRIHVGRTIIFVKGERLGNFSEQEFLIRVEEELLILECQDRARTF